MNIESTNLSSLAPSNGTVDSAALPLADGGVISKGFSSALVAQIELLNDIKTEGSLPLQTSDIAVLQGVSDTADLPTDSVGTHDFAALLGKDLPPSYKTKDDVEREAVFVAITDTLKYIAVGTTTGEKAVVAEQNIKDVIAMAVPVEQSLEDVIAAAVSAEANMKDRVIEVEQSLKDVVTSASVQMGLTPAIDRPDKQQVEGEDQMTGVEDNLGNQGGAAVIILPVKILAEPGSPVNNLTPEDAIKEGGTSSFIKPLMGNATLNESAKVSDDALQSEAIFSQAVQEKQGLNLKYVENVGLAEKTGRGELQALNLDGEKGLPRVGVDIMSLNRAVVDNKADISAITKPLSHPEWNKDLGERIVWMSNRAIPSAEIRLNPLHLGPISVRVDVTDNQATVVFTAQHAATREALEASIPKLREMMGAQQVDLVEVNISQGTTSDQGRQSSQRSAQAADGRGQGEGDVDIDGVDDIEPEIENGRAVVSKGLLSIYA
ncbi:MAG: flagellar hook-length control protein FliK [Methylobacter sp.]|uniref:Flagellar hook-length control protein FliK n=1 Tax=Candidatus Methylobacter titanis TaxID=3053457 RepID=A0AA43TK62_9GAMM|nr:flagellar hook-length control protein FliK [Candidatus Methylobacter titanis]